MPLLDFRTPPRRLTLPMVECQHVCLIGPGTIGRKFLAQVPLYDTNEIDHEHPTKIVGIVSSSRFLISDRCVNDPARYSDRETFDRESTPRRGPFREILDELEDGGLRGNVAFVDASTDARREMAETHLQILAWGGRIVTANKAPLAVHSIDDFRTLTQNPRRYQYGPSVMAGAPTIPVLREARDIGEIIHSIEGCLSGTLGSITSETEDGRPLSASVRSAKKRGDTETHPWMDMSGEDITRKLVILARTAGFSVDMEHVRREPFIPESYGTIPDVPSFLDALQNEDGPLAERMAQARERGSALRYVARLISEDGGANLCVGWEEVALDSAFGRLRGTRNLVRISSQYRGQGSPQEFGEEGAGVDKTACAIRAGLTHLLPELTVSWPKGRRYFPA